MNFKFGRRPRRRDPKVPHYSAITAGTTLAAPPASVDWTAGMGSDLGFMLNNSLGDCTCAAYGHALQVWSYNAAHRMVTVPDSDIELLYERSCGYVPGKPSTDQGGVEQDVLGYLLNTGTPIGPNGTDIHNLTAFVEVDPRNVDDVKRTIADCAVCYIGFNVPAFLPENPGSTWNLEPGSDQTIKGGHAVVLAGYDSGGARVISWGSYYRMTWGFFGRFVDECYAIADPDWVAVTGKTPGGVTLEVLEQQMAALKEGA